MSSYHGWSDRLQSAGVDIHELDIYEACRSVVEDSTFANAADAAIEALAHELLAARSWEGVLAYIDRTYPAEVFTGVSGDPGPRLIALLRRVKALERMLGES